jgi:hypothetical protein
LPDWAKGYAKDTLAKASQLTDINKNPYQPYGGQRNAELSPMQTQAMQGAANMSAGPEAFSQGISGYMSPYMQNVVDIGKREATRQSGIQGTQQQAQATQSGGFGGSRDAIMRAERERNLGMQLGDIQDKGMQSAYDQAANQFRQGITQGMDINKLQAGYGGMQQAQVQKELDTKYGDFGNQMNYPYKQLGFMSDMIRGLPVGTASSTTQYQAPGSVLGQLGGLGVTAMGLSRYMADGGEVHGYASGGSVGADVENESNIAAIIHQLPDAELQKAAQAAAQRGDKEELRLIEDEFAMRASLHSGVASVVPSGMMGMADDGGDVPAGANGGIVAFKDKGLVDNEKATSIAGDIWDSIAGKWTTLSEMREQKRKREAAIPGFFESLTPSQREEKARQRKTAEEAYKKLYEDRFSPFGSSTASDSAAAAPAYPDTPPPGQQKAPDAAPETGGGGGGKGGSGKGRPSAAISDNLHPAIAATVDKALADMAASGKVDSGSLQSNMKSMYDMISQGNGDMLQSLKDQITQGDQQVDETKGHALGNILMAFGANWAAGASKPGATALGSAAGAAPAAQQEMATQDKILRDMRDAQNKIKMDYTKFQISLKKDDQKTALTAAQEMQRNAIATAQLAEQAATHRGEISLKGQQLALEADKLAQDAKYQMGMLGIHGAQAANQSRRMDIYDRDAATREQANKVRLAGVQRNLANDFDKNNSNKLREYQKTMPPLQAEQRYKAERNAYVADNVAPYLSGGAGISSTSRYPSADSLLD